MTAFSFVRQFIQKGHNKTSQAQSTLTHERQTIQAPALWPIAMSEQRFYEAMFDLSLPLDAEQASKALSVPQRLIIDITRNSLAERDARMKAVPRLPSVIPKLLRSLRDPDASAKDYVEIIDKDPAMSAAVLKLANSAYFNPTSQRISSINVAVVNLGIEGLRAVLSAAVMQPVIQRKSDYFAFFGQRLWEHSLCCAVACEVIGQTRGLEPYKGYLLGLSHDIGKITLFSELCKQFKLNPGGATPNAGAFIPVMMERSASLSSAIAMDWELPKELCTALQQQVDITPGKRMEPYGHLLFQANLLCEAYAVARNFNDRSIRLERLAEEMNVPQSLFDDLDRLSLDV